MEQSITPPKFEPEYPHTEEFQKRRLAAANNQGLCDKIKAVSAQSLSALGPALNAITKDPIEKAWVVYYWMSQNIAYDDAGFFSGNYGDNSADAVFKSRKCVCAGYSALLKQIGESIGLEIETIHGYAKGYGFTYMKKIEAPNHDWSAIKLEGNWYLMDSTWGTGHINSSGKFQFELVPFYFLCPAEEFIFNHFPQDEKWQLLKNPMTEAQYYKYALPAFGLWDLGFKLISPFVGCITMKDTVKLNLPRKSEILLAVEGLTNACIPTFTGDIATIEVAIPTPGQYKLQIFGKNEGQENHRHLITFDLDVKDSSANQSIGFPTIFPEYYNSRCSLISPKLKYLKAGDTHTFAIKIPGATEVVLVTGNNEWNYLTKKEDDLWEGDFEAKGKEATMFAKINDQLVGIIGYNIN